MDVSSHKAENGLATIAITAFNAEETIAKAVSSALSQDYYPREILILDDASTDNTLSILESISSRHPEVRILRHTLNKGVAAARNTLLENARGDFVVFFDDDDESTSSRVRIQIAAIITYEYIHRPRGPVFCHTARLQTLPDGSHHFESAMGCLDFNVSRAPNGPDVARWILAGTSLKDHYGPTATCSQAARKSAYMLVGEFDEAFRRSEDTDYAIRAALIGSHFIGLPEPMVAQTITFSNEKTALAERDMFLAVVKKHRSVFLSKKHYKFTVNWIHLKHEFILGRLLNCIGFSIRLFLSSPTFFAQRLFNSINGMRSLMSRRRTQSFVGKQGVKM